MMTVAVAIGPFIEMMDLLVANVALRHIAGSLSIGTHEAAYVITAYMVSNAIVLPITGWIGARMGYKRYFMWSVAIFTIASVGVAASQTLRQIVGFAIIQGLAGGALQPLSQTLLVRNYPRARLGLAMSIWAMTMVTAPALGPFVGGWIADSWNWRWIFLINLPFGLLCLIMVSSFVPKEPVQLRNGSERFDYVGLVLLVLAVGSLQFVLDRGEYENWLASPLIASLVIVSIVGAIGLVIWELGSRHPLLDLSVFKLRSFTLGTAVLGLGYGVFFCGVVLTPLWLQSMLGYTATWAGLALMPTGTIVVILLLVVGRVMPLVDLRWLICSGLILMAFSFFYFSRAAPNASLHYVLVGRAFFGVAMALFFAPISTAILSGLDPARVGAGAGISGLFRNLSASIGTAVGITLWDSESQRAQSVLAEHTSVYSPHWQSFIEELARLTYAKPDIFLVGPAFELAQQELLLQARTTALTHIFEMAAVLCLGVAILSLAIGPIKIRRG